MSENKSSSLTKYWPVYLAVTFVLLFGMIFLLEFIQLSQRADGSILEDELTSESYMDIVAPLLVNANPENGAELVELHGCNTCHAGNAAGNLAPPHTEVASNAAERRPPLTAAAYIYESIIYPGAYTVEPYQNNMPRLYDDQIPENELGDIIAYLLEPNTEG